MIPDERTPIDLEQIPEQYREEIRQLLEGRQLVNNHHRPEPISPEKVCQILNDARWLPEWPNGPLSRPYISREARWRASSNPAFLMAPEPHHRWWAQLWDLHLGQQILITTLTSRQATSRARLLTKREEN